MVILFFRRNICNFKIIQHFPPSTFPKLWITFSNSKAAIFFVDALSQILDRILSTPPHLAESFREFSSDILLGIVENFSHITEWLLKKTAQELFEKYHHPFYQPSTIYDLLKTWLSTSTLPPPYLVNFLWSVPFWWIPLWKLPPPRLFSKSFFFNKKNFIRKRGSYTQKL